MPTSEGPPRHATVVAPGGPSPAYVDGVTVVTAPAVRLVSKAERQRQVSPNGTPLWRISSTSGHDLPVAARRAYETAAVTMERERPGCGIRWWLLAGIGRVESDHGRYGGSRLGDDGISRPRIRGIALNGVGPVAAIHDSDNGRLDGDKVWDRAVGPMQFIPTTWAGYVSDGDGDGRSNPNDIDDAALGSAKYLCGSSSLHTDSGMRSAVFRYNHSEYYVDLVMAFAVGYHTGVFDLPEPPVIEVEAEPAKKKAPKKKQAVAGKKKPSSDGDRDGSGSGSTTPKPTATSTPKATATKTNAPKPPASPEETEDPPPPPPPPPPCCTGKLAGADNSWTVGGTTVDFGTLDDARRGRLETLRDSGDDVTVKVVDGKVTELNGEPW